MANFGFSFGRGDAVRLDTTFLTGRYPNFLIEIGVGLYIHVNGGGELDVAEQVAQRLLEGVAAMREELKRREQVSVVETVG